MSMLMAAHQIILVSKTSDSGNANTKAVDASIQMRMLPKLFWYSNSTESAIRLCLSSAGDEFTLVLLS